MSMILCPECGTKISDKATVCPHCGFQSKNRLQPISEQDKFEVVPTFKYDIKQRNPNSNNLSVISYDDNRNLVQYFGDWKIIQTRLPDIAEVISNMANKQHIMIAKMDSYVKDLIDTGVYRFAIDKNGEILPTIRDANGFVKQVRLEDMTYVPNLTESLNNLSTHAMMVEILNEIEFVGDKIKALHIEMQNDRLAMAESARDKLYQARKIKDTKLREEALLITVGDATDAKRVLMKNFTQNLYRINEHSKKSDIQLIFGKKSDIDVNQEATDSMQSLISITNAVQIECEGYAMLGEYESCKECLGEFKEFIIDNKLDERDTLLLLNESTSNKQIEVVDEFADIANRITSFEPSDQIETDVKILLTPIKEDGGDEDD